MSEDERTVERADDVEREATQRPTAHADDLDPDAAAESFLELDEDLDVTPDTDGTGGRRRGIVADADRVSTDRVPEGYPLSTATERAVALTVDFGDGTTTVYLAWPDDAETETELTWLLDAMGIDLRELYGKSVLVERVDGYDALVTPDERPRGSDWRAGVIGGLGVVAGFVALLAATSGPLGVAGAVWALVTLVWLPYTTHRDAWYVRTRSDWGGGPLFWATLSILPFFNLITGTVYLWQRSRARFFAEQPSVLESVTNKFRSWL